MATQLPSLKHIERLSPRVVRVLGGNPGKFSLQGTNTYLIGTGRDRLLIDSGEGRPAWLTSLKEAVSSEGVNITSTLLTHWHHDHISGVSDLLSLFPSVQIHKNNPSLKGEHKTWLNIHDGQVFKVEGATLTAVHCPGHTTDHMAFVLEEEDAMFTGDNVLGHGTAVFEDLATYLSSLELMGAKFNGRAYPGHGDVIENGKAKIKEYIAHRKQREGQVLDVLGQAKEEEGKMSSMEIVKVIYADYPENLHQPAEMGVVQVLRKLVKDGRVQEVSGRWKVAGNANL